MEESQLKDNVREYVDAQIKIAKLKFIKGTSSVLTSIIVGVAIAILGIFILMFLGFSAAYGISSATNHPFLGFLIVAGIFIALAVVVVVFREKLLTLPIVNVLMARLYYKDDTTATTGK